MITDAEFWMEIRRHKGGRNDMFKGMLALVHAHQSRTVASMRTSEQEQYKTSSSGNECLTLATNMLISTPTERSVKECQNIKENGSMQKKSDSDISTNFLKIDSTPPGIISPLTIRVLQQIMLYAVPIYKLRYCIPAMSMSWSNACFIDHPNGQLVTFGSGQGVQVPGSIQGRGCVAGDGFFAILTNNNEVWASGGLKVSRSSSSAATPLGMDNAMFCIGTKAVMLAGHGQRLAYLTKSFVVRSLSAVCTPTRSVFPSRRIRFLDLGYGNDYHMIGMDSILYKTTATKRTVSTPRRVMSFSRNLVSRVSSGMGFLLIIDQNGHLYTSGRNRCGQLGNGRKQETHRRPYLVDSLIHHFITQVAAGECHSLALTSSGVVYSAGANNNGQLGLGSRIKEVLHFTPVPLPSKCLGIAAGPMGSMFACEDGQVLTCGLNDCMQLGLEARVKIVYTPTPISFFSGVETYTMDFGGYLYSGQTQSSGVPNRYAKPEGGFSEKDSDLYFVSKIQAPPPPMCDGAGINKEVDSLDRDALNVTSPSKALLENRSENDSLVSPVNAHADKACNERPDYHEVDNHCGEEKNHTPEYHPNEPIAVQDAKHGSPGPHIHAILQNNQVEPNTCPRRKNTRNKSCQKCCVVL